MKKATIRFIATFLASAVLSASLTVTAQADQYPGLENLSEGQQNEYVEQIQVALVQLGYEISPTNGRYGPQTVAAISAFYSSRGDRSDGTSLGPAGYKAILSAALEKVDSAKNSESNEKVEKKKTKKKAKGKAATRKRFKAMGDVTLNNGTRKSRNAREQVSFEAWRDAPFTKYIAIKESNKRCKAVNRSGKYRGRWQMDKNFWKSYGGRKFAKRPEKATCAEQDLVAYRGWIARGWQPWNY